MTTEERSGSGDDRKRIPEWDIFCNPGAKYTTGIILFLYLFIFILFIQKENFYNYYIIVCSTQCQK